MDYLDEKFKELMDKLADKDVNGSTNDFLDGLNVVKKVLQEIYKKGYSDGWDDRSKLV